MLLRLKYSEAYLLDLNTTKETCFHSRYPSEEMLTDLLSKLPKSITVIDIITPDFDNKLLHYASELSRAFKIKLNRDITARTISEPRTDTTLVSYDPTTKLWRIDGSMSSTEGDAKSKDHLFKPKAHFRLEKLFEGNDLEPWLSMPPRTQQQSPEYTIAHARGK